MSDGAGSAPSFLERWVQSFLNPQPYVDVHGLTQGWGTLQIDQSISGEPLRIHGVEYARGLGSHAPCEVLIRASHPLARITAYGGIDDYAITRGVEARIVLTVEVKGKEIWRSSILDSSNPAVEIDVELGGGHEFTLKSFEVTGNQGLAHVDWVNPQVTLENGTVLDLVIADGLAPQIPFDFQYGERSAQAFFRDCEVTLAPVTRGPGKAIYHATYRDRVTQLALSLELTAYSDFPAVEWIWRIKNHGAQDTPILRDIQALELVWAAQATEKILHHSRGSDSSLNDFLYQKTPIDRDGISLGGQGGRSSYTALPFFNIQAGHKGLVCAIGWTGQWKAEVGLGRWTDVRAGLEHTHLRLHPGEEIRTPRILLIYWEGEPIDGNNLLRRFILAHHTRRVDGRVPTPISFPTWGGMRSSEHRQRLEVLRQNDAGYSHYWMDAGWYGPPDSYSPDEHKGDWALHVGNWQVNPAAHPDGLLGLSEKVREAGMKFTLWFEPERAIFGTPLTLEHPDWFLGPPQVGKPVLLNLGNPLVLRGLIDLISALIEEHGVDCYRQDFNIDPLSFWQRADAPDRQGIAEIRHIENLYAFWDALLERFPHLIIDNCASGGRRIDLETTSRSIPLWRSDVQCFTDFDPLAGQVQTQGLAHWVPCSAIGTHLRPNDSYNFRSAMCTGVAFHAGMYEYTPIPQDYPWDWHRKMLNEHKRAIPYFLSDYYPLIDCTRSPKDWTIYQMHDPATHGGCVVALRREQSVYELGRFPLKALEPGTYQLEDVDSGEVQSIEANELTTKGLSIHLAEQRSSRLIFYTRRSVSSRAS